MASVRDEEITMTFDIELLPDELILTIFRYLPLDSILICENVSERWRRLALDATIWRHLVVVYTGKPGDEVKGERGMQIITTHNQHIQCLKVQYVHRYPVVQTILDMCNHLISLELVICRVNKEFALDIFRWPNLRKLSLKNSVVFPNSKSFLIPFETLKNLRWLTLSDFALSAVNCRTLLACKYLHHISIEKIQRLDAQFITELITSRQLILTTLHIYGADTVNDNTMHFLSQCPLLCDLAVIRCENFTDKGLLKLTLMTRLRRLQLWNNSTFSEIALLKTLASPNLILLESLSFSRIEKISSSVVDLIMEQYKSLKFIALYMCPQIETLKYEKELKDIFRDVVIY